MEKICRLLNCTPNEVIVFQPDESDTLQPNHQLRKLEKKSLPNANQLFQSLSFAEIGVLAEKLGEMKRQAESQQ